MKKVGGYIMKRNFFCLFIVMTILLTSLSSITVFGDINDAPNLVIGRGYKMPVFKAGEEVRLSIPIENTTSGEAINVLVAPVIEDTKDFPFEIDNMITQRKISNITGRNTETVAFYLKVKKNVEAKIYPMKINIQYASSEGGGSALSETIYIKIENDYEVPDLKLIDTKIDGNEILSGDTKGVGFVIQNKGNLIAKDIEVQLGGFINNQLILDSPIDIVKLSALDGGEEKAVYFNISADKELESGNYSLDLTINYKDEYEHTYKTETKAYLYVEGKASKKTNFTFDNLIYPQEAVTPYTDFNISFDLKNSGDTDANNVKVSIDAGEEILPKSMSVKNIGILTAGKSKPMAFTLFAKENIESKNYPIKITVEYETGSDSKKEVETINQYVGVLVDSNDRDMGEPKIIIDRYDYGGEFIEAGKEFPLTMSFYNTNTNKDVRNIRVSLSSDGDIFSPVGSSNSFFIPKISANKKLQQTIYLKPKINAEYKTHNVFAEIEYEDTKGKSHTTKELIGIPVIQETNLITGDLAVSNENFVGTPAALSLEFYNAGRGLMRNMIISIEGDFDTNEGSLYIGDLEAGKNNYYDATIIPTSPGTLQGKIIFDYDDEIDQHYTIEKEFSLEVMEQMEEIMPEDFMEHDEGNPSSNNKIAIAGGVVLLIIIAAFVLYKRRKKKLEEVDMYE